MIDPQARPAPYVKLLAVVVGLGLISALVTFTFMALVHHGTVLIWEQAAQALGMDPRLFTLLVCTIGGALLVLESAQGGSGGRIMYIWVLFPSLLASAVAIVVFVLLSGHFFETLYSFPAYTSQLADMFYAVPLGLIGAAVGALFMLVLRRMQRLFQPMKGQVVLRGLLNRIAHLLSLIPYEEVPYEKVKHPKRGPKGDYVEPDYPFRRIPGKY